MTVKLKLLVQLKGRRDQRCPTDEQCHVGKGIANHDIQWKAFMNPKLK